VLKTHPSNSDNTTIELLAEFILRGANARLLYVQAATKNCPTLVHFCADISGQPPACVLPAAELSQRNVCLELAKFNVEEGSR
jgi:hypothetical protein